MLATQVLGQRFLSVENMHRFKRFRFYPGDEIRLKLKNERYKFRSEIISVQPDTMLVVDRYDQKVTIPLKEIGAVYYIKPGSGANLVRLLGGAMMAYGVLWAAVRGINAPGQGDYPVYRINDLIVNGSIFVVGAAITLGNRGKRHIGKRWQVTTLDLGVAPPKGNRED